MIFMMQEDGEPGWWLLLAVHRGHSMITAFPGLTDGEHGHQAYGEIGGRRSMLGGHARDTHRTKRPRPI